MSRLLLQSKISNEPANRYAHGLPVNSYPKQKQMFEKVLHIRKECDMIKNKQMF